MKTFKYFLSIVLFVAAVMGCTKEEFGSTEFASTTVAPSNVIALYNVTQDNTGFVTITPNSEGAVSYDIYFGDGTTNPVKVSQGKNTTHTYAEGTYTVKIIATGITGLKTEVTQPLVVSFKAPENPVYLIENDPAVSKRVNVTVTADYGMMFEVYFGEVGNDVPVSANIGGTAFYDYENAGIYTIRIVVKSAAIQTLEHIITDFEVTEILQPLTAAPIPPARVDTDVVSIFSDAYTNVTVTEWNPNWGGQSTVLSPFAIGNDNILKYDYFSYTGIVTDYGNPTDLSSMEYVHFDYWTNEGTQLGFKIVNTSKPDGPTKESEVVSLITEFGKWVSVDIPLADFTTDMSGVTQLVLSSTGVTVFIDNIYFYKSPSTCNAEVTENIDPAAGNINWNFKTKDIAHSFEPFGDIASEIVDNPLVDAVNGSCNVQSYVKTANCQTWSGVGKGLTNAINLTASSDKVFKMNVFAKDHTTEVTLRLEFEPYPNTEPSAEVVQTMTKTGAWEELTFDFSAHVGKTFKSIIVYFDRNNACDAATYYFDDLVQVSGGSTGGTIALPFDFETTPVTSDFIDFDGATATVVNNIHPTGNSSTKVAQIIRNGGQVWAGSKIILDNNLDFSTLGGVSMKVYTTAPIGTVIKFKLEGSAQTEVDVLTTVSNAWETLTWDFTGKAANTYNTLVLMFDFGNVGNGSANSTFLFDDIMQVDLSGGKSQIDLPVDFESATIDYTLTDFGGNASSVIVDPTNAGNMVAKVIKSNTAATWAGTTIGTNAGFTTNIPITLINSKMSVRVWSPASGTPIRLKIEDSNDPTHTCETETNTTMTAGWETLVFDFTNQAPGTELLSVGLGNGWVYNKASIFFNFGTDGATAGEKTYYFDDVLKITN